MEFTKMGTETKKAIEHAGANSTASEQKNHRDSNSGCRKSGGFDYATAEREIISRLDIVAEYQSLGVRFAGEPTSEKATCYAIDRDEKSPSACVFIQSGKYHDSADTTNNKSFWEFAVHRGSFSDFREARAHYAERVGVPLPGRKPAKSGDKFQPLPWNDGEWRVVEFSQWLKKYKATASRKALEAVGARVGRYPVLRSDGGESSSPEKVIAFPCWGSANTAKQPQAHQLMQLDGRPFASIPGNPRKASAGPVANSIMGKSGLQALFSRSPKIEQVHIFAGPTCLLAAVESQTDEEQERFPCIADACGETGNPPSWLIELLAPYSVAVHRDADKAGNEGAEKWKSRLGGNVRELRTLITPFPVKPKHGNDVRDFISGMSLAGNEGEPFTPRKWADLLTFVDRQKPFDPTSDTSPVAIDVSFDEEQAANKAIQALAWRRKDVYQRNQQLTEIVESGGNLTIRPLAKATLRERISACTTWHDGDSQVSVPAAIVEAVAARGAWNGIPQLAGIVTCPVLRKDGSIITTPGYDQQSGLFYRPVCEYPEVSERPTQYDANDAGMKLMQLVVNFPFYGNEEQPATVQQSAWLAAVLTPLARFAFDGPSPLFLFEANKAGTGKGLLAKIAWLIVHGGRKQVLTAQQKCESEWKKTITSLLLESPQVIVFDNLTGSFGNGALDALFTSDMWQDRKLGKTEMTAALPNKVTWWATANNITLVGDIHRRIVPIKLETPLEKPEEQPKEEFDEPDLEGKVELNHAEYFASALTLLRGYFVAGCPDMGLPAYGSYIGWGKIVRNAIKWAGFEDPVKARKVIDRNANIDHEKLDTLIAAWLELDPESEGMSVAEALKRCSTELKESIEAHFSSNDQLGKFLRSYKRNWRQYNGQTYGFDTGSRKKSGTVWRLCVPQS